MQPHLTVRRARRDDFERVRRLLGADASAGRAERKQFRRLVSTLREDLYLVERADDLSVVALAVIVYVRGLGDRTAVVRQLRGAGDAAALLLDCARARALARGCARLEVQLDAALTAAAPELPAHLADAGWRDEARTMVDTLRA